ncbi:MAG: EAL domain-containing protein [Pseudomonadota bacterium]
MTAIEPIENVPFSIIHITGSVNDSIALRGELRNAGLQASVHNTPDFDAVRAELEKSPCDVVYIEYDSNSLGMLQALRKYADRDGSQLKGVPVVVYGDSETPEQVAELYEAGAFIVITDELLVEPLLQRAVEVAVVFRERERMSGQLAKSELRCQKLIDGSSEAVAYIQDGLHIYANQVYLDLLGFSSIDELREEPILDLAVGDSAKRLKKFLKTEGEEDTFTLRTSGGHEIDVRIHSTAASFDGEPCLQIFASEVKDDSEDVSAQLEYFARRDLLTGLYNRNYLFEQIQARREEIAEKDEDEAGALLLLEILNHDDIKRHIGTTGMDNLLTEFGKKVEEQVGGRGLVARHGAFSFLVLLGHMNEKATADLAEQLNALAREYVFSQGTTSVTVSTTGGYLVLDENSPTNPAVLVDRVERASARAAMEGAYQARLYQPDIKTASEREQDEAWARKIKNALRDSRFALVFQPIVSLTGNRDFDRFEVFVRMLDEDGSLISPTEFLSQAERADLIQSIDRWVVLSALKELQNGIEADKRIKLFIRVSDVSLHDPEFAAWLAKRLETSKLPDTRLVLQVAVDVAGHALTHLSTLRETLTPLGVDLILDGFGTGDDDFRILDHLPVPSVKVARALMEGFARDSANQERVTEVVEHTRKADLEVIVPNVEDAFSLQILWPLGVDFVQGNFIQEPQKSLEFDFDQF